MRFPHRSRIRSHSTPSSASQTAPLSDNQSIVPTVPPAFTSRRASPAPFRQFRIGLERREERQVGPCPVTGFRPAAGHSAGSSSKAAQCAGRTARKCRWSMVATWWHLGARRPRSPRRLPCPAGSPRTVARGPAIRAKSWAVVASTISLATRQCVEERGLDCGTWLDLEEVGDLGDDQGRDDDRALEPPEQCGAGLMVPVLWRASPPAGRCQRSASARFANSSRRISSERSAEIRCTVEQADEGEVPHRLVGQQRFRLRLRGLAGTGVPDAGARQLLCDGTV